MKILSVEFLSSMVDPMAKFPSPLPQIAFTGRSNAGKSSLINTLLQRTRKKIAHVSSRPGKTQALNFFEVNRSFLLVDLPGFGYAKAPAEIRDGWKALTRRYIARPDGPAGIVHLLDIRRDPGEADADHLDFLAETGKPVLIVLTKVDKLNRKGRLDRSAAIRNRFALDEEQTILFSSVTGEGREELSEALLLLLEESAEIGEAGDTGESPASEEIGEAEERSIDA